MIFIVTIFMCCSSTKGSKDFEAVSTDTSLHLIRSSSTAEIADSLKEVRAIELFRISITSFLSQSSTQELKSGRSKLRYMVPSSLFVDGDIFYLPDRSGNRISMYSRSGKYRGENILNVEDFSSSKLILDSLNIYFLDIFKGFVVLDRVTMKEKYSNTRTINFFLTKDNFFLENKEGPNRSIQDVNGIIAEPYYLDYHAVYIVDSTLFGLYYYGDSEVIVEEVDLTLQEIKDNKTWNLQCENCFYLPKFLGKDIVLSSRNGPTRDHLTFEREDTVVTSVIRYPEEIKTILSMETANYSYSGYFYYLDGANEKLYSICSDSDYIYVYEIDY